MNVRFFRNSFLRAKPSPLRTQCRRFATATQPPVLLLAEVHTRPAANHALYHNLSGLKNRGYNILMREGIKHGKTLQEEVLRGEKKRKIIFDIIKLNPQLIALMQCRYQMTLDEFSDACQKELSKTSLNLNASDYEVLINFMMQYDESSVDLDNHLIANAYAFQNLDEDYYPGVFRPLGSRRDLDFRDEQYVNKISDAYKQGCGVISILGGLHLLSDFDSQATMSDCLYNRTYGKRQTIGDRLCSMGIPFVGLFPFRSDHTPVGNRDVTWQKQLYHPSPNLDPSNIYSIDVIDSPGKQRFLSAIDNLTAVRNTSLRMTAIKVGQ